MVVKACTLNLAKTTPDTRVKVLVVDDSPFMLRILTEILEEAGHFDLVGTATDGCQGLRYVSLLSPELVLMDIHMPRLNGIQATRCIKQREHPPVVIIVSSDDNPTTKAAAEAAGADGFVIKQGNLPHQLLGAIQGLFGVKGAIPAKTSNAVNEYRRPPNETSEKSFEYLTTHRGPDPALPANVIRPASLRKTLRLSERPLWEAHSARKHGARIGSSKPSAAPSVSQLLSPAKHSRNCALPHESSPPQRRAATHTTL